MEQDRYFSPGQRDEAAALYETIRDLPLICPHGHVDPRLFVDESVSFGTPVDLLLIPDHYIFRMLYSQGISLEALGIPRLDGGPVETDHRKIWGLFAQHFHLFRGTPTGVWLAQELEEVFGVRHKLDAGSAQAIYDQVAARLSSPDFKPRSLFERFNIEVLCTTDAATDDLAHHAAIRASGWAGRVVPTFRPDNVVNLDTPGWRKNVDALSAVSGIDVVGFASFIQALEQRRAFFKGMGATATDHAAITAFTGELSPSEADAIFQSALKGQSTPEDACRFTGHMLIEMARMSSEDGLVMQLHVGAYRDHNPAIFERFGPNMGADIPVQVELTRSLRPLLNRFGTFPDFRLILFTLDEAVYSREMAPLAGHYPALRLGPPWWFFDSLNGMRRYFDLVIETAGLYNTAGFNDDTRAFPSIPARHDLWRRAAADWAAGLVVRRVVDMSDGLAIVRALAYDLAKESYRL